MSWYTRQPVRRPRVLLGTPDGQFERTVTAVGTSYTDAKSGQVVYVQHARISRLRPNGEYPTRPRAA